MESLFLLPSSFSCVKWYTMTCRVCKYATLYEFLLTSNAALTDKKSWLFDETHYRFNYESVKCDWTITDDGEAIYGYKRMSQDIHLTTIL